MRTEPSPQERLEVTPQLILAGQLLQFSAGELEESIAGELAENPALELAEEGRCTVCGALFSGKRCPFSADHPPPGEAEWTAQPSPATAGRLDGDESWEDPLASLPAGVSLQEHLLWQMRPHLQAGDLGIAQVLVDSLDDHGFLSAALEEMAILSNSSLENVERVLGILQQQEPVGIGARSVQEGLLLQLAALEEESHSHPLARIIIEEHWDWLARGQWERIAGRLKVSLEEVQGALAFIQANLNPYPAHAYGQGRESAPYARPDIVIQQTGSVRFLIEFPEEGRYRFRVSPAYTELLARPDEADPRGGQAHLRQQVARAELFMRAYQQRWETLRRVVEGIVQEQKEFFATGEGAFRHPLTRAQLAQALGLHESTVSRAVANKYLQLPGGSLVPLAEFFEAASDVKERLRDIVRQEKQPLSDGQIAELLRREGYRVARRTVAKYRESMGILPASLRRAQGSS